MEKIERDREREGERERGRESKRERERESKRETETESTCTIREKMKHIIRHLSKSDFGYLTLQKDRNIL